MAKMNLLQAINSALDLAMANTTTYTALVKTPVVSVVYSAQLQV